MQSNQIKKGKPGFAGLKFLIGTLSLTGTFGIWGLIANKSVEAATLPQDPEKNNQLDASVSSLVMDLPPLPTLVPVRNSEGVQNITRQTTNQQPQELRQVSQPTLAPAPANKPVFERLTISRPGSSSGGGGGSSSGSSR